MSRVRISTTVDAERLRRCREAVGEPDSRLLDRALAALLAEVETAREIKALAAAPYEHDEALAWVAPAGPALPYDGDVPADVVELAAARRRARQG